jgi:protein SCO1/2
MNMRAAITLTLVALAIVTLASLTLVASRDTPEHTSQESPLPEIAPAPEFTLTSQDGAPVTLADFRGKVVAVTFIYTLCTSTCPVLTPMMSFVQDRLGADFGAKIAFVSITVDPERDTPEVLKEYAQAFGANLTGWSFLTGTPAAIRDVARKYGVYASKTENGDVEHTFLTSIIDSNGILRVQYLGVRFDPEEFRRDLLSLKKGQ